MGLQQQLGFDAQGPNGAQRVMQRVGASRPGAWLFQRTLYRVDKPLYRWTDGRFTVPTVAIGIPVIMLTTTGARSGESRTMPVMGIPVGGDLAVIGSNYGQPKAPSWVFNLLAHPEASVRWRDRTVAVTARLATEDEYPRIWDAAAAIYLGFPKYRERVTSREVRTFVLEPRA